MESINICGTNCRKDILHTFTYEQLAELAKIARWQGDVDKELRKHGFKPSGENKQQSSKGKQTDDSKSPRRRNNKKQKGDS